MISVVPLLQGKSEVQLTWGCRLGDGDLTKGHRVKNLWRTWNPNQLEVFVPFLTCDLSVKRSRKRRISLQRSIKHHFFMNLLRISLTETSTEKCFYVCCCSQESVPPIEALNIPPICRNEILSLGTYTPPKEVTDQNEIQTCLLNVMRIIERSLQGSTRLANCSFLFFAFLMPLPHCTEQSMLWAVSHDFGLLKWKCFRPFRLTFETTKCRVFYSSLNTVYNKSPVNQVWWHHNL